MSNIPYNELVARIYMYEADSQQGGRGGWKKIKMIILIKAINFNYFQARDASPTGKKDKLMKKDEYLFIGLVCSQSQNG